LENTEIEGPLTAGIDYAEHLWQEKELKTVANVTSHDIRTFLEIAAKAGIRPEVQTFSLEDANKALHELRSSDIRGAKVLAIA
jgi:propanol-preferring alcohol dehydrogenase